MESADTKESAETDLVAEDASSNIYFKHFPLCFLFDQTRMLMFKILGIWTSYDSQEYLSSLYLRFHLLYVP